MTNITFPLSEANVAQCMAERDAEIEWLRQEKQGLHNLMQRMAQDSNDLAREIERLRAALQEIADSYGTMDNRARRTLEEK